MGKFSSLIPTFLVWYHPVAFYFLLALMQRRPYEHEKERKKDQENVDDRCFVVLRKKGDFLISEPLMAAVAS